MAELRDSRLSLQVLHLVYAPGSVFSMRNGASGTSH